MEWLLEDPNVQELIREWEDKGLAKGRDKVLAEGRVEGRAEEARKLLYKVLWVRSLLVTPSWGPVLMARRTSPVSRPGSRLR